MLGSDLGRGVPAISGPNSLAIRFPPRYNHSQEQCQAPERLAHIEGVLAKITGQVWKLRIEAGGDEASPAFAGADSPDPQRAVRRLTGSAQALFQRAEETLRAQVVREDEGFGALPAGDKLPEDSSGNEECA